MQRIDGRLVFSPSDLNHFLECEHLTQLQRRTDARELARPRDAQADLLARKGLEHERAWFDRFVAEGRDIVSVAADASERDWTADAARTVAAMRLGVEIIYQGVFEDGDWHGIGDFLVRVDNPSALGAWSYEAWDTKLARQAKPYFALQLSAYSEHVARIQGTEPEFMRVVLGTGRVDALRYRDFASYYRNIRARFLEAASADRETYPRPVSHCSLCEFSDDCEARWRKDEHLSLVYGLSRAQVERLNEAGVLTVADLAVLDPAQRVGIGPQTLQRLRHQAALQTHFRQTGCHKFELLPATSENGFRLMPAPSDADIFFDMEGYPYFEPAAGLEYLFGAVTKDGRFLAWHASHRVEEKKAFEDFIDFVQERLKTWPDLHVYHYAAYEPSTLKRLMSVHATREDALDDLLRREVFVDLYQVVRQAIRMSHASYSIKKVRTFFMPDAGQGAVTDGGESILEFERYLETRDATILDAIARYNEEDCVSTIRLRDWLLEQRKLLESTSGVTLPWKTNEPLKENPKRVEEDALTESRRVRLEALRTPSATLMASLLGYHRREAKPEWWAYFERQSKSQDDLLDDVESLAFVELDTTVAPVAAKRSSVCTFRFPPQETKIRPEMKVRDPFNDCSAGEVVEMDAGAGWVKLLRGPSLSSRPSPTALVPDKPLDNSTQRAAVGRVADTLLAGEAKSAVLDILHIATPRVAGVPPGAPIQTVDLEVQKRLVASLDNSYLFIQGPPGSGKTYTGGRLIVSLLRRGKRIGVAAHAHKAIHNLLNEVVAVAREEGVTFRGVKKSSGSDDTEFHDDFFENIDDPKACDACGADLIAGTSWQFAREAMEQTLDYLFIDEAGQVSLADAIAMGTAARNIVLLGDPQQLPHVSQGVHAGGSGCSVLEHLLGDHATVASEMGLFLATSWRMHPEVCSFVSELSYDQRLTAAPGRERQVIASGGLAGAGLRFIPVSHTNNAQQSPEEATAIAEQVELLLRTGTFTEMSGNTRPLEPPDILVVSPYNMQVRLLAERLPAGVEVGTVHKFQGREAPIVFFSMASSSGEDVPRGLEFLFSRNSLNVAVSRARALAVLVCSPRLLHVRCATLDQIRLVNNVCRFVEAAAILGNPGEPKIAAAIV